MKKHAIIPIFIPHKGCPNACVFCNQRAITARERAPEPEEVRQRIEQHLNTLRGRNLETIEIAFFGGSFTGIHIEQQKQYLDIARQYKRAGEIQKIHLSTRPDYINDRILDNLKEYETDVVELGVQSFDDTVLKLSNRGHDAAVVYESCRLIRKYGFELGIQLMIGLPGDSYESCMYSAGQAVSLAPDLARLYPTIVLRDTELYQMRQKGTYTPPSQAEVLRTTKDMYRLIRDAGIYILRVGLKSTELIQAGSDSVTSDYHPAFRQLVEGELAKEDLEQQLNTLKPESGSLIQCCARGESFSNMVGNRRRNAEYLEQRYPSLSFRFVRDDSLPEGIYQCRMNGTNAQ